MTYWLHSPDSFPLAYSCTSHQWGPPPASHRQILGHESQSRGLRNPANHIMTSSNGNIFRVTGPLWGESTGHRWIPLTKASDAGLWCFLWSPPERLSKQLTRLWFQTPSCSLWCQCNEQRNFYHEEVFVTSQQCLNHCDLVTPYDSIAWDLGQHWFM